MVFIALALLVYTENFLKTKNKIEWDDKVFPQVHG